MREAENLLRDVLGLGVAHGLGDVAAIHGVSGDERVVGGAGDFVPSANGGDGGDEEQPEVARATDAQVDEVAHTKDVDGLEGREGVVKVDFPGIVDEDVGGVD